MIVYNKTKQEFSQDVMSNYIGHIVSDCLERNAGHRVAKNELRAFENSLGFMDRVVNTPDIPDDSMVSIEYHLPQTSKRVDFIITGQGEHNDHVVIVELKQWETAQKTSKDGIVRTRFQNGEAEVSHPSYQAWSYAAFLEQFNETVGTEGVALHPCAYLHNYEPDTVIKDDFYAPYVEKAPVFLKPDALKLREFIKRYIKKGDTNNIMVRIDNGRIRPSKTLADSLKSMMQGNTEFIMLDEQKVVYETAIELAKQSTEKHKNLLIVEGGPGTGKSVVAINLLVALNQDENAGIAQYVTKTSAPRDVYFEKLKGDKKKTELKLLFVGSGSFITAPSNIVRTLIVDEAHRLTEKTGFLKRGNNQIREILNASVSSVFFIDEDQRVSIEDYATIDKIERIARQMGIHVYRLKLESQFRCNGSDGYLAWLDNALQIRETANYDLRDIEYDFQVFDKALDMQEAIYEKNKINNRARIVAGYCWKWESKDNPEAYDFKESEFGFNMKWNMTTYGGTWIIDPHSVTEVGCIHTAQGLETDYIGVIMGDDFIVRDGQVVTNPDKRDSKDKTILGWKKGMKSNPQWWKKQLDIIIKNTYRTLMTRGMKGCYLYCTDEETREYFKNCAKNRIYR